MPRMPNNETTPASVAARLTDEEILRLAEMCFYEDHSVEEDQQTAAVLLDFVRIRSENADLRECLREAVEWSCGNPDEACEDCVAHGGDTPCKCEKWRKALKGANDD